MRKLWKDVNSETGSNSALLGVKKFEPHNAEGGFVSSTMRTAASDLCPPEYTRHSTSPHRKKLLRFGCKIILSAGCTRQTC